MSTLLKDLSTVCRANFVGYNKNFSDGIEDHRISNHSEERESKIGECVKMWFRGEESPIYKERSIWPTWSYAPMILLGYERNGECFEKKRDMLWWKGHQYRTWKQGSNVHKVKKIRKYGQTNIYINQT